MSTSRRKLLHIIGNRPQFIKVATLLRALPDELFHNFIVHSGQHYDYEMSQRFFEELQIPNPDCNLEVGSGSHGLQTGRILAALDPVLESEQPDIVLVYGDTNTTLAGALSAYKAHVTLVHVEAGFREFAWRPEEINRTVSDHCADYCFCSSAKPANNLRREGFAEQRILVTGDLTYDSFLWAVGKLNGCGRRRVGVPGAVLLTLHRAETVDDPALLDAVISSILDIDEPLCFPVHPRTRSRLESCGLWAKLTAKTNVRCLPPLSYLEFLRHLLECSIVLTDSGGVTREAYYAGKPSVILDKQTEYTELICEGAAALSGHGREAIGLAIREAFRRGSHDPKRLFGDGDAAWKMASVLRSCPIR